MEQFNNPSNVVTFTSWLLALIIDANQLLSLEIVPNLDEEELYPAVRILEAEEMLVFDALSVMENALHSYRLCFSSSAFPDEVSFWVKPRSTAWFSRFLVQQYDNPRWISMFKMTKEVVFNLADLLEPHVQRRDTNYCLAVPVLVRIACTLFKLTHGANLTICSEMFAIRRSTVSKVLREVVHAINNTMKNEISWPRGDRMRDVQEKFQSLCSLPAVVGAIDGVHVCISKPNFGAADYFYFKKGAYAIHCQAIVDTNKRFLNVYVGMSGSTNDSRVLRRSPLHHLATHGDLVDASSSLDGFTPYVIGDMGYPLLPWLMVLHRGGPQLSFSESLFNKKLRRGSCIVENAFGILKQCFRKLLVKTELHVTFVPDVVLCCAILHNVLLKQSHEKVERFLSILRSEGLPPEVDEEELQRREERVASTEDFTNLAAVEKRSNIGVYLSTRRRPPP